MCGASNVAAWMRYDTTRVAVTIGGQPLTLSAEESKMVQKANLKVDVAMDSRAARQLLLLEAAAGIRDQAGTRGWSAELAKAAAEVARELRHVEAEPPKTVRRAKRK